MTDSDERGAAYLLRRSELARSVHASEGFSVNDAIVDKVDLDAPNAWLRLVKDLNDSQQAVVAVVEVHAHAQFNGLQACLTFHGPEFLTIAADGAARLGATTWESIVRDALKPQPDWVALEERWDMEAEFEIESFIEEHASDFFVAE